MVMLISILDYSRMSPNYGRMENLCGALGRSSAQGYLVNFAFLFFEKKNGPFSFFILLSQVAFKEREVNQELPV